jgi:integrase
LGRLTRHRPRTHRPPTARQEPEQILDEHERWDLLRRCLHDDAVPLDTRAAAALVLLFGLPISRIRHLTIDQLDIGATDCFLRTGRHPLPLPPKLANLLTRLADAPYTPVRLAHADNAAHWLFPGLAHGRPTSAPGFHAQAGPTRWTAGGPAVSDATALRKSLLCGTLMTAGL